jgi:hypothetical protein
MAVILPLELCLFTDLPFGNETYSVISDVDYRSTNGNSRLLNRVHKVILNWGGIHKTSYDNLTIIPKTGGISSTRFT